MNQGIFDKFFAKIRWLRNQPENVKVRYIWIFTVVIVAIVALLWLGLFRKYERRPADDGKSLELIFEEGKKIKEEIGNKIKMPEIKMPEISPEISPIISPLILPEVSPEASSELKIPSLNAQ